jgi:2-polyprenyl-6-methoxyphenol hydroxylase-like FAD-dependent oxidoreductase
MEVLIVGGGIGGLTAALALHAHVPRARIRVLEAAPKIKPLGVGINLLPYAGRELSQLGLRDELARVAVEPTERLFFTITVSSSSSGMKLFGPTSVRG